MSFAKNLSSKYGQTLLDSAKKSKIDPIKTASKGAVQKTAETTGNLIGKKIADKITSVSKKSSTELHSKKQQNNEANDESEVPKKKIHLSRKKTKIY